LTGGSAIRRRAEKVEEKKEEEEVKVNMNEITFFFNPGHYTVMENVGKFTVTVTREGDLSHPVELDFVTEDGTANEGSDYEGFNGTIVFHAGEGHKSVSVYSYSLHFCNYICCYCVINFIIIPCFRAYFIIIILSLGFGSVFSFMKTGILECDR
jgi:hypothetical protein